MYSLHWHISLYNIHCHSNCSPSKWLLQSYFAANLRWILPNPIVRRRAALSERARKGGLLWPSPRRSRVDHPPPPLNIRWRKAMEPTQALSIHWKRYCYFTDMNDMLTCCLATLERDCHWPPYVDRILQTNSYLPVHLGLACGTPQCRHTLFIRFSVTAHVPRGTRTSPPLHCHIRCFSKL